MKQRHLRLIRIIVSVGFLLLITVLFVDYREFVPTSWSDKVLFFQFVPSVLDFLTIPALTAGGFIVVLVLTLFFGRVYCSLLCPLGVLQDIFAWISKKTRMVKRYRYRKALNYLRYSFLAITIAVLMFGSLFVLNFLDPYSIFGRFFSDLVRPGLVFLNNGLTYFLEKAHIYFLFPIDLSVFTWDTVLVPIITIAVVVWLSLFFGRLYCNTVCPVGTLLGLVSKFSLFKIRMDSSSCTRCGKCSVACKSSCIQVKTMEVDFSRCVTCYDCISACPEKSIRYTYIPGPAGKPVATDKAKRDFMGKSLLYMVALAGFSKKVLAIEKADRPAGHILNNKHFPVTPPGSVSLSHFTGHCTACHLCITACPTRVLQPSFLEYGFMGMMQPRMDYKMQYCDFECTKCSEVCPTGAIMSLTVEDKKLTQTGKVSFIKEKCIVYTDNTACGSCSEHCPTQAVKMVKYKGILTIPETNNEICIGCGACEFACPVRPHPAIFVDGNEVQQVAKAPPVEELDQEVQEDFLF